MMNDFANEPSEGATSSLLAQKTLLERVINKPYNTCYNQE